MPVAVSMVKPGGKPVIVQVKGPAPPVPLSVSENGWPTLPGSSPPLSSGGKTSISSKRVGEGDADAVVEQVKASGRDQLPWAGLVKTRVALPEKVSEAGLNVAFVPPSNSLVVPPGGDCTFILLGAVVVPSGHTQWKVSPVMTSSEVIVAVTWKAGGVEPQSTVFGCIWLVMRSTVRFGGWASVGVVPGVDEPVGADELPGPGWVQETEKVAVFEDAAAGLSTTRVPDAVLVSEAAVTVAGTACSVPGVLKVSDLVGPLPVGSSQ